MHNKRRAFTVELGKTIREIPIEVIVLNEIDSGTKKKKCRAVIDTGATISVVSPDIAEELELDQTGETTVMGVNGAAKRCKKHSATIGLPNGIKIDQEVVGAVVSGTEVLIGMDLISKGDFTITHTKTGEIVVSFAYPPFGKEINFESKVGLADKKK